MHSCKLSCIHAGFQERKKACVAAWARPGGCARTQEGMKASKYERRPTVGRAAQSRKPECIHASLQACQHEPRGWISMNRNAFMQECRLSSPLATLSTGTFNPCTTPTAHVSLPECIHSCMPQELEVLDNFLHHRGRQRKSSAASRPAGARSRTFGSAAGNQYPCPKIRPLQGILMRCFSVGLGRRRTLTTGSGRPGVQSGAKDAVRRGVAFDDLPDHRVLPIQ